MILEWSKLLSEKRVSALNDATPSTSTLRTNDDTRSEFQRDYDRILFSTPVRRLQDKAQVFPLEPNDSVRTRLTHSHEVANIAQGLARRICSKTLEPKASLSPKQQADIVAIVATCGLIHDAGNPPFGHSGEEAMKDWFIKLLDKPNITTSSLGDKLNAAIPGTKLSEDFRRFDGNPQTIRLLTKLQMLGDYDGLNLTAGTLSASLKYVAKADQCNKSRHAHSKPGFFYSEKDIIEKVRQEVGTGDMRNPLTFIVEAADDIVYSAVDLEDGFKKGAFTWGELEAAMGKSEASEQFKEIWQQSKQSLEKRKRRAVDLELTAQAEGEALAQILRTIVIGRHMDAVVNVFDEKYDDIMSGKFEDDLLEAGSTATLRAACKKFAQSKIFTMPSILKVELMGRRVINELLDLFWSGVVPDEENRKGFDKKTYALLSENYRAVYRKEINDDAASSTPRIPTEYRKLQLIADYLCGMTDTFAITLHRELFNA
ncbi:dGTPase [Hymenobacter sp. UYAg731]